MYKAIIGVLFFLLQHISVQAQTGNTSNLKTALESSPDPVAYVKKTKKKWRLDTVFISSNKRFFGLSDSLGYYGKIKKVYGPYGDSVYMQILAKAPNVFYRASHILLDTSKLNAEVARSLADTIISKVRRKSAEFEDLARIYNTDGSGPQGGDLGWRARGTLLPALENAILKKKKNDIIKVWTSYGLHVVKITGTPVQDAGFAIILSTNTN
ncbi:peptidylprolyl isomerase [Pollutibacter soli]|uniref:peptidylprolyl isomerase n=1 Tax=Pollutibacter soli TaxID=3034157 RepID=UPI0030139549